ncbi:MAG: hypothetical protein LBF38_07335 [Deltaproteobacteria bacterium]|jgi:flagellar motility protein MotE (MotC chaperone)|nr:hypothetical protein [Deltaproteobacteria bacterium]
MRTQTPSPKTNPKPLKPPIGSYGLPYGKTKTVSPGPTKNPAPTKRSLANLSEKDLFLPGLGPEDTALIKPEAKNANLPAKPKKKNSLLSAFLSVALVVLLFGLVARLIVSGLYLNSSDGPIPLVGASPAPAKASAPAVVTSGSNSAASAMGFIASGSMASGAAILTTASPLIPVAAADAVIPLPPGDEDLRRPQRPPSAQNNAAPRSSGSATLPAPAPQPVVGPSPGTGANPQLPPNVNVSNSAQTGSAQNSARAEELAKKEFDLNRREAALNAREEALKTLEADVNTKLASSERSRGELNSLIARNQAILDEQKALKEQQQKEDEELKDARIQHLVAAFKGMKPEQAGLLISSMDDMVAVSILSAMPGSNAGKILAMVTPDKAARLVKSISEQRIDPKAILEAAPQVPNS